MEHKTVSLADQVFERLEHDILTEKYKQGELLTEMRLCEELGVSRTPIREALRRLSQENLIKECSKGNLVLGITKDDLYDIFTVRLQLEGIVAALAAEKCTKADIEELKGVLELQEFYGTKSNPEQIKQMDNRFHETIYKISGSNVYYNTLLPLIKKVQKYRRVSLENGERAKSSILEHREIFEAIAAKNTHLAKEKMTSHVKNAFDSTLKGANL